MFNKRIFLDFASTTPVDSRVFKKMQKYFSERFANCQSIHREGYENKKILEDCRQRVARLVQAKTDEVIFTSGGTDSNNLAIIGLSKFLQREFKKRGILEKPHLITSNIEHVAVLNSFQYLEKNGFDVTYLEVDEDGLINPEQIYRALKPQTILVSIMLANNEIGTVLPVRDVSRQIAKYKKEQKRNNSDFPYLHTDASQAPNYLDININRLAVDLMSLDGSKIYGPKGVGCLIKKNYLSLDSLTFGGGQEGGLRAGTENLPLIVGFTEALELTLKLQNDESKRLRKIQKYFIDQLQQKFPQSKINGSILKRLPNNVNVCFRGINSEFAVIQLDALGIACSAMTACRNLNEEASSYVVEAVSPNCGKSSLRFSFGRTNKKSDVDRVILALSKIIK